MRLDLECTPQLPPDPTRRLKLHKARSVLARERAEALTSGTAQEQLAALDSLGDSICSPAAYNGPSVTLAPELSQQELNIMKQAAQISCKLSCGTALTP